MNGKTYYADPSNQQLKTGTAVIDNVTYIFDSTGMLISEVHKGIDVSSHQGIIDWNQVRTSGVQFAVIRIMSWQGDAATGGYAIDPDFERNIREARAAGIYVGAYWYSVAFNGSEALQEVNIIKNSVAWNNVLNDGIILDLPMFIDYENNTAWFNSQTTYAVSYTHLDVYKRQLQDGEWQSLMMRLSTIRMAQPLKSLTRKSMKQFLK